MKTSRVIYVHGASGFIGRHFIKKLAEYDANVFIFARKTSDLKYLDHSIHKGRITIDLYDTSLEDLISKYSGCKREEGVFVDFAWFGVFNEYRMILNKYQ